MKIDVFMRTTECINPLRRAMREVSESRWLLEDCNLGVLWTDGLTVNEFREECEQAAKSDPYIFTDDDVLIVGKNWVKRAVEAMLRHPEYAICSTLSLIEGENMAKGEGEIYDMHAVGQPMLIRKGILTDLPEMDLNSECGVLHKYVLDKGYKMGLINGIRHNHLGHGFSSNPALFWGY